MNREAGAGVLVTTHSMGEAEQCDRLVVMVAGRVVASGTADGIIGDASTVAVRAPRWEDAFAACEARACRWRWSARSCACRRKSPAGCGRPCSPPACAPRLP